MKPFNLEAAKAGAKVVTRNGSEVTELHHFETSVSAYPVIAIVRGSDICYTTDGKYYSDGSETRNDLFMAPVTRTVYVNLYEKSNPNGSGHFSVWHATKSAAERDADHDTALAVAVPVTITE